MTAETARHNLNRTLSWPSPHVPISSLFFLRCISFHGVFSVHAISFIAMALTEAPASRFQHHVSFDNFAGGEPTEKNAISFTLNVKHKGYSYKKRSRTFMVGIDENAYSEFALQWMLEELVDDRDEIVCLRVVDKDAKISSDKSLSRKEYQEEARMLMQQIQAKNDENRAISIVLEFAVGKVHTTFQKMVSYLLL